MAKPAAIEFSVQGTRLRLVYRPRDDIAWVHELFDKGGTLELKNTFRLSKANLAKGQTKPDPDVLTDEDVEVHFDVAKVKGDYFVFDPEIVQVDVPVLVARNVLPTWKWFTAERDVSVLKQLAALRPSRIVIGGEADGAISVAQYERLLAQFPNSYELRRYVQARVSVVFRELSDATVDGEAKLRSLVAKRVDSKPRDLVKPFRELELSKYEFLYQTLTAMLQDAEGYRESVWQAQIMDIVRLLNPKYIAAIPSVSIKDSITGGRRQLDILLVDVNGNIDVIEIKKPFDAKIVTETKYRDNHVPHRELAGTVTQVEKYLFHLNRWGAAGETWLTEKYRAELPPGMKLRIVNPCGLIISGRDNDLTDEQKADFEIFRRQNKNVVDVITYDDLLRRLDRMVKQLKAGR